MSACRGSDYFRSLSTKWNLSAPYFYNSKDLVFGESLKFTLKPAIEVQSGNQGDDSVSGTTLWAPILGANNTVKVSDRFISAYNLEFRYTSSKFQMDPVEENFLSTLQTIQTYFINKWTQESLAFNVNYSHSTSASQQDNYYDRYQMGTMYIYPLPFGYKMNLGFNYSLTKYDRFLPQRVDNNYTLSAGVNKYVKKWAKWMVTASYANNNSTDVTQKYKQYSIISSALFNYAP
ncbi:MAG: hypothetical protein K1X29_10195 [Bdellovibrionales bacterium]|nr:hypothetical protein [Bdellovibrionales bacterium]